MFLMPILSKFLKAKLIRLFQPCPFGFVKTSFKDKKFKFLNPNCLKKSSSTSLQAILSKKVNFFVSF